MNLLSFLLGSVRVRFLSPRPERIVNAAHRMNLPFGNLRVTASEASFEILSLRLRRLDPFLATLSCAESITLTKRGLPHLLHRYRRRYGFFAGLAVFIISTLLANCLIWGISVTGVCDDPETVFASLADAGLKPGIQSRNLDTDGISRRFLLLHPEYAYAGIRRVGMLALVELRAAEQLDKTDPYAGYSNMVADTAGRVLRNEIMSGEGLVKPGDLVRKGDLLISGIRRTESGSFLPTRARGRVICEMEEGFETFVPFREEKTVLTGREETGVSFDLLGHCVFAAGQTPSFLDHTDQSFYEPLVFLGRELPVYRRTVVFSERVLKMTELDVDRAKDIAYDRYIIYKRELLDRGGEIRLEEPVWEESAYGVALRVHLQVERDLCREVPFTILSTP